MSNEEIVTALRKLQYQVSILGQSVDYKMFPVENLIMNMDWGPGDIDKAHDVFERWDAALEAGEKVIKGKFENDFEVALGLNYQGLKSVVVAFWDNDQWTNVCEAYVESFDGMEPVEYNRIARRQR